MTAFVPTYRCGAAPDLHRIPSFHADDLNVSVPTANTIYSVDGFRSMQHIVVCKDEGKEVKR
jgi:hypothetical protein